MMREKFKKMNWELDNNRRFQMVVFLSIMAILVISYMIIRKGIYRNFETLDDFSWTYQIDEIKEESGELLVSGFAFRLEEDSTANSCEIILREIKTGKRHFPKMNFCRREDVNDYFFCEYDYTKSGFVASFSLESLDLDNEVYEILLRPMSKGKAFSTGVYYAAGKMMFTNPEEFVPLETVGTDLEKITTMGVLRVYRPDFGMYVYQYGGELYWIAEPYYGFVDGNTFVEFQMNTTQIANLPEDRLVRNYLWSDLGFHFHSMELTSLNTGKYRVAKCVIPTDYSITKTWTGNYIDEWIWIQYFRPWYDFAK